VLPSVIILAGFSGGVVEVSRELDSGSRFFASVEVQV
jgi:hypothetical protein